MFGLDYNLEKKIIKDAKINEAIKKKNSLEWEIDRVNKELDFKYRKIGELHVRNVLEEKGFNLSETIESIGQKLKEIELFTKEIIEIEREIENLKLEKDKEKFFEEIEKEMERLDKAVALGIVSEIDYGKKVKIYRNKVEYFKDIRSVQLEYEMKNIDEKERDLKIKEILER